jgi:hypothetical protein
MPAGRITQPALYSASLLADGVDEFPSNETFAGTDPNRVVGIIADGVFKVGYALWLDGTTQVGTYTG